MTTPDTPKCETCGDSGTIFESTVVPEDTEIPCPKCSEQQRVIDELRELMLFLCGEGPMVGLHFGETNPAIKGNFWWRSRFVRPRIERALSLIERLRASGEGEVSGDVADIVRSLRAHLDGKQVGNVMARAETLVRAIAALSRTPIDTRERDREAMDDAMTELTHAIRSYDRSPDKYTLAEIAEARDKIHALATLPVDGSEELRRDAGRWVEWKPEQKWPEIAKYRCAVQMPSGDYVWRDLLPDQFDSWEIAAYWSIPWSIPLPPPYDASKQRVEAP